MKYRRKDVPSCGMYYEPRLRGDGEALRAGIRTSNPAPVLFALEAERPVVMLIALDFEFCQIRSLPDLELSLDDPVADLCRLRETEVPRLSGRQGFPGQRRSPLQNHMVARFGRPSAELRVREPLLIHGSAGAEVEEHVPLLRFDEPPAGVCTVALHNALDGCCGRHKALLIKVKSFYLKGKKSP